MASRRARLLAAAPAALLLGWGALLAVDVLDARKYEDPAWVASQVGAVASYEGHVEPVTLAPGDGVKVWILGSSSVAAPRREAFTDPLRAHLDAAGQRVAITNLGWEGMTSWDVRHRLETALAQAEPEGLLPDVAVLYLGHNDVTYTFHYALQMPRFDALIAPVWVMVGEPFRERKAGDAYWLFAHRRAPRILEALQEIGWLHLDPATFTPLLDATVTRFRSELELMVGTLQHKGARVVLVTPIGNLEAEPFGPIEVTTALWARGLAEADPAERLALLEAARDSEVFTSDMRAKTALLDVMRSLGQAPAPGVEVAVCDLGRILPAQGARLGADLFVDPVHLSTEGFDQVTAAIAGCLVAGPLAPAAALAEEAP